MKIGSVFSGIGGLERGLELAGVGKTVWQCDIEPYALKVLAKHWPDARRYTNVEEIDATAPEVEVLCGGFPCQPVSSAGLKLVQEDERWLWPEFARVIGAMRPSYIVAENVKGLRKHGMVDVLRDLAALGYDAEWTLLPAAAVGAPHLRERFFIIAWERHLNLGRVFHHAPPVSPWWTINPERLPRLLKGVPDRRPRLTALGNAVVPIAAWYAGMCLLRATIDQQPVNAHAFSIEQYKAPEIAATYEQFDLLGEAVDPVIPVDPVNIATDVAEIDEDEDTGWRFPFHGRLISGKVAELVSPIPKMKGKRLWPTPAANEAEWSVEALAATVDKHGNPAADPHARLYHQTTGQIVQRGLANYVRGVDAGIWPTPPDADLWPTPHGMSVGTGGKPYDGHGNELSMAVRVTEGVSDTTRSKPRNVDGGPGRVNGGPDRQDSLLPTPTASDASGSRRATAAREGWTSKPGTTLTDAAWIEEGVDLDSVEEREYRRRDDVGELLGRDEDLLPTPLTGPNRKSVRAMTSSGAGDGNGRRSKGGSSSSPGLEQVAEILDGQIPRELEGVAFEDLPPSTQELLRKGEEPDLWATPTCQDGSNNGGPSQFARNSLPLNAEANLWPTPLARAALSPSPLERDGRRASSEDLQTRVLRHETEKEDLWPTPATTGGSQRPRALDKLEARSEAGDFLQLADEARLAEAREGVTETAPLNPEWVGWLMGFPADWTVT